ncbi:hypothetical protein AGMMS50249_7220 [candidate division SR1 bacterium]|nr:hypothetical protein AGMMS50249_7220 [candidate division SR1 bacterium]
MVVKDLDFKTSGYISIKTENEDYSLKLSHITEFDIDYVDGILLVFLLNTQNPLRFYYNTESDLMSDWNTLQELITNN